MSVTHLEREYTCYDDCRILGCPSHVATLEFSSVSGTFLLADGRGVTFGVDPNLLEAWLGMLKELAAWRVEAANILEAVRDA